MTTRTHRYSAWFARTLTVLAIPVVACNTGDIAQIDGGAADSSASDAAVVDGGAGHDGGTDGSVLQWFTTCGDPVCRPPGDAGSPNGAALCTTEYAGNTCSSEGAECDPGSGCGVLLRCATTDPKRGQGGCPVSTRSAKDDIRYLNDQDLERVAARLETTRLATYSYKNDPSKRKRLGFIIDDDPASMAVADTKTSVDLYAYTSMVVAALKVQSKRVASQEAELGALRRRIEALEKATDAPGKR